MPNVHDDDEESLLFADESEWMDEQDGPPDEPEPGYVGPGQVPDRGGHPE